MLLALARVNWALLLKKILSIFNALKSPFYFFNCFLKEDSFAVGQIV